MGFMQRQIELGDWYEVETDNGSEIIPADLVGTNPRLEDFELYCEGKPREFELKKNKYGARLSAPGYMDKTDWDIFDTEDEAKKYLEETYPEDDEEA